MPDDIWHFEKHGLEQKDDWNPLVVGQLFILACVDIPRDPRIHGYVVCVGYPAVMFGVCNIGSYKISREITYQAVKRQTKIGSNDILIFYFYLLKKKRLEFFMRILCPAEDSLETSSLIFSEKQ